MELYVEQYLGSNVPKVAFSLKYKRWWPSTDHERCRGFRLSPRTPEGLRAELSIEGSATLELIYANFTYLGGDSKRRLDTSIVGSKSPESH